MNNPDTNPVMTIQEVADYLQVSPSTIYKLANSGQLPGRKVGGRWRFARKTVEAWLASPLPEGNVSLNPLHSS